MIGLEKRQNLVFLPYESWRPPVLSGTATATTRVISAARRLFDLQAASIWKDLKELLPKLRGNLLDAGCGAQPYRALVPARVQYRAIDLLSSGTNFGYRTPDTAYFQGESWPVEDGSQDVILCTEVAEHVYDPAALFAESFRCLRPGGRLVLTVPFAARWHFIPHDYWRFTPSSLDRLLDDAGFKNRRIYARGNALTVLCYKALSLFLPLLVANSSGRTKSILWKTLGITFFPFTVLAALIGNLTLMTQGGNDCLGYTVLAERP